jgi:hypothetical protein
MLSPEFVMNSLFKIAFFNKLPSVRYGLFTAGCFYVIKGSTTDMLFPQLIITEVIG